LPEKTKKEVDKKTNIIFNYNPTTYELNNKEVSKRIRNPIMQKTRKKR